MKSNSPGDSLVEGIDKNNLPKHIAVIMDGNGRWAKKRLLNRVKGHEKGMEAVRTVVRTCREIGVSVLSLYAFSTENWRRPKAEIAALMGLLHRFIDSERDEIHQNNIRVHIIGQKDRLPGDVQRKLNDFIDLTRNNDSMLLNIALSYGGRTEIAEMAAEIAGLAVQGKINPADITEALIADHLYTRKQPDPDMLIRTSGEMRISNFLLWQLAYTELFFPETLWPDFGRDDLIELIKDYQKRKRRFGKVTEE